MKFYRIISALAVMIVLAAIAMLSTSCENLTEKVVITMPAQTLQTAGFQLRPTEPNTVYTDTATNDPNAVWAAILAKYDTSEYKIKNITIGKVTIHPSDGATQLGALCEYMKVTSNGDDLATTVDGYDSTAVDIALTPVTGANSLESIIESLDASPLIFECKTSDKGVTSTLGLSLDVDVIIELDPNN